MSQNKEKQIYFGSKDELYHISKMIETDIKTEFDILKNYSFSRDKEVFKSDYCHIHYGDIHTKFSSQINEHTRIPFIDNSLKVDTDSLIKPNDLVIADASEDYKDLGKSVFIENLSGRKVLAGLHTFHLRAKDESIAAYFNYFTQTSSYKKQMGRLGTGTSVFGISKTNISKIKFEKFSDPQNNIKCSVFLSQIDNLINGNNRKVVFNKDLKKLIVHKYIYLNKSGDSNLLSDIVSYVNNNQAENTNLFPKITISLHKNGLKFLKDTSDRADSRPFYIRKSGEIIIGKQNYFNGSIAIVTEEFNNTISSNAIISFGLKNNVNIKYIYELLSTENFYKKREILANGTGQKELSQGELMKFKLTLPEKTYQDRIAEFLSQMDNYSNTIFLLNLYLKNYFEFMHTVLDFILHIIKLMNS